MTLTDSEPTRNSLRNQREDPTTLDHARIRKMLQHDGHRKLTDADRNRVSLVLDDLHFDGCATEAACRRIDLVARGGHMTAVLAMACTEADAGRLSARGLIEVALVVTTGKMPR